MPVEILGLEIQRIAVREHAVERFSHGLCGVAAQVGGRLEVGGCHVMLLARENDFGGIMI